MDFWIVEENWLLLCQVPGGNNCCEKSERRERDWHPTPQETQPSQHRTIQVRYWCTQLHSMPKETREGWPLLTIETKGNGDSKSTNQRGPSLVGSLGLSCRRYKRFLFCLGCYSLPSTKYFFLTVHYFNSFVPIAEQVGQAAVLGHLPLSVCLWVCPSLQAISGNKLCTDFDIHLRKLSFMYIQLFFSTGNLSF